MKPMRLRKTATPSRPNTLLFNIKKGTRDPVKGTHHPDYILTKRALAIPQRALTIPSTNKHQKGHV